MSWIGKLSQISNAQIQEIDQLQQSKNNGRGVGHVQEIIKYLQIGDFKSAKAVFLHDYDKMSSYSDLDEKLKN